MRDDFYYESELMAAGTTCPMVGCGALIIAYRPRKQDAAEPEGPWEFTCPRCGAEFETNDELLFQSVPEEWLLSGIHFSILAPGRVKLTSMEEGENHDEFRFAN